MEMEFSEACERNKDPILEVLKLYINDNEFTRVLEIGAWTGQHAVHFAKHFKNVEWVATDGQHNHPTLKARIIDSGLENVKGPFKLEIGIDDFPDKKPFNAVFTANTFHIMNWKLVKTAIKLFGKRLREGSLVLIYGPFNYNGNYTSESNQLFDESLKARGEGSAIRNVEDVTANMEKAGFEFLKDHEMPANNRLLVYRRKAFKF